MTNLVDLWLDPLNGAWTPEAEKGGEVIHFEPSISQFKS